MDFIKINKYHLFNFEKWSKKEWFDFWIYLYV